MKRTDEAPAFIPRAKLLPACLALALAVGANAFSPEQAAASTNFLPPPLPRSNAMAPVPRARLTDAQRRQLVDFMRSKSRTLPIVPATSIAVTNCNDAGPGSYREAINAAVSGDTIDLTNTGCSQITLTTGDILTAVNDLTLQGPGALSLTISGGDHYRPLEHIGFGLLKVYDLAISNGKKYLNNGDLGAAGGACIHSAGAVVLTNSWAKYCDAGSSDTSAAVKGGAIYGATGITVIDSIISGSIARSTGNNASGGGLYTPGYLTVAYSSISGNSVTAAGRASGGGAQVGNFYGTPGGSAFFKYSTINDNSADIGGGLYVTGDSFITNSTISANDGGNTGGVLMFNLGATGPWKLLNSTISGNSAIARAGGVYVKGNNAEIDNSTIAFNSTHSATKYGGGLAVMSANTVDLQSTIISNNTTDKDDGNGAQVDDVGGVSGAMLTGANNLVYFPSSIVTPGGTILLTDPILAALAFNGGTTATHGLITGSVAVDVGNNVQGTTTDQRGSGYPRVVGPGPDIGAFEGTVSDTIFADGFD